MRMVSVVVGFPFIDPGARIVHREEPGGIQAFLAKPVIERLYVGVIRWFSGAREVELDLSLRFSQRSRSIRFFLCDSAGHPKRRNEND